MPSIVFIIVAVGLAVLLTLPALLIIRIVKATIVYQLKKKGVAHIPRYAKTVGFISTANPDPKAIAPSITNPETGHYYDLLKYAALSNLFLRLTAFHALFPLGSSDHVLTMDV
jgi:hypothetical protein